MTSYGPHFEDNVDRKKKIADFNEHCDALGYLLECEHAPLHSIKHSTLGTIPHSIIHDNKKYQLFVRMPYSSKNKNKKIKSSDIPILYFYNEVD